MVARGPVARRSDCFQDDQHWGGGSETLGGVHEASLEWNPHEGGGLFERRR